MTTLAHADVRKKHLVFVTTKPFFDNAGGGEKVLCNMANEFVGRGYKVTILCCDKKGEGSPFFFLDKNVAVVNSYKGIPLFARQTIRNFRCLFLPKLKKYDKRKEIECGWQAESMREIVQKLDADMYICQTLDASYILKVLLKIKQPIITMYHLSPEQQIAKEKNRLVVDAANRCDAFQVLIPEYIKLCRPFLPKTRLVFIPNVVPQYKEQASLQSKKIICVSNFEPQQKRPSLLIEAFSILHKDYPDWIVEFWGRSNKNYEDEVRTLIQERGLTDSFLLCGTTKNIKEKVLQASIFAFPSAYEGFSLALTEAMALGVPAVGCLDCISVRNIIKNKPNGLLTEPNPVDFSDGLRMLMDNYAIRDNLGKRARSDMKKYSSEVIFDEWEKLIQQTIKA